MRQYQLDEIARIDIPRIREYLDQHGLAAGLADIWWVDLPEDLLSPEQFSLHVHRLRYPPAAGRHPGLR
jgi:hypothetical protein